MKLTELEMFEPVSDGRFYRSQMGAREGGRAYWAVHTLTAEDYETCTNLREKEKEVVRYLAGNIGEQITIDLFLQYGIIGQIGIKKPDYDESVLIEAVKSSDLCDDIKEKVVTLMLNNAYDPAHNGTDTAHPAWLEGADFGIRSLDDEVNSVLDGLETGTKWFEPVNKTLVRLWNRLWPMDKKDFL